MTKNKKLEIKIQKTPLKCYKQYILHFSAIGKRFHIFNNIAQER